MVCASVFLTAAFSRNAHSFVSYVCNIEHVNRLSEDGTIDTDIEHPWIKQGSTFVVERETGKMSGDLTTENWPGRIEVLDQGSSSQSYKAIHVNPPHIRVRLVVIREYEKVNAKPFLVVDDTRMFTGTCRHGGG
jgi:hypothetical protein